VGRALGRSLQAKVCNSRCYRCSPSNLIKQRDNLRVNFFGLLVDIEREIVERNLVGILRSALACRV
jgi:hypothetical protein